MLGEIVNLSMIPCHEQVNFCHRYFFVKRWLFLYLQAGATFLAVRNYRKGVGEDFVFQNYEPTVIPATSPISVPGVNEDRFLPTPFSGAEISKGGSKGKNDPPQGHSDAPRDDSVAPQRNGDAPQESGSGT